ncbi:MAG: carboxypeptidase-like regulatory domain-containing protein [Bacteroidia bacterium]|nr:carboxypeptidase-like regulatory domain-containing protein [Bacteroidia bacterium]
MKARQASKLSMYLAVKDFLVTNAAIATPLPNYSGFSTAFLSAITQIQTHGEQQMFDKSGLRANKDQLRSTLVMLAADTSRKLQAYARYVNNQLLLSETKFSESELRNASDNVLRDYAQGVYDRAQTNLTALAIYGITASTQTSFVNAINAYVVAIPKPRIGTTETKQSTLQLASAFEAADGALGNIDAIVEIVKLAQPNFYSGYKSVRKLIETGNGSLAVKGVVTDAVSGAPLKNVSLSFALDGNGTKLKASTSASALVKKSAAKGGFNIKTLAAGMYNVTIRKNGYADQVATIAVSDGESSVLNVKMSGLGLV